MKSLLISAFLFVATYNAYADLGSSTVYKGTFIFKGGYQITGYIEMTGYHSYAVVDKQGKGEYTNSDSLLVAVKARATRRQMEPWTKGEFTVYEHIYTPLYFRQPDIEAMQYGAIKPNTSHLLNADSLVTVKFISAYRNNREWLMSELSVLPRWMLEKLENEKPLEWVFFSYSPDLMEGYYALSYNSEISKDSLYNILSANRDLLWPDRYILNMLKEVVPHTVETKETYKLQCAKYTKANKEFRYKLSRLQIIIVRTWSTC